MNELSSLFYHADVFNTQVDGKISTARKKRSRKLTRGKTTEPFIDYSITKPCLGISPYSKTDPNGTC